MNKHLIVIGIVVLLLAVGLSGCVSDEDEPRIFGNMKLTSSAFNNGESIPLEYTCDGDDVSPLLTFSDVPENATSVIPIINCFFIFIIFL